MKQEKIKIEWVKTDAIRLNPRNARVHSKKQIRQIAASMKAFGVVVPMLVDESLMAIAGAGRFEAGKLLNLPEMPVIRVKDLSEAKKRALMLADNRIAQSAGWDRKKLAEELPELTLLLVDEELDISVTGFEAPELDQLEVDFEEGAGDPSDDVASYSSDEPPVTTLGDVWQMGEQRLLCGDARDDDAMYAVTRADGLP